MESVKKLHWPKPMSIMLGVAVLTVVAVVLFQQLSQPSVRDLAILTAFLAFVAVAALTVGYAAHRLGLIDQSPRLGWAILGGYVASNAFAFVSVWILARLMFLSSHDLILASVLLLFASGIAVALGYFLAMSITDRIASLNAVAARIAEGHLDARAMISGQDEVSDLGHTLNVMATQLEAASRRQRELETLRRDLVAWVGHDLRTPLSSIRVIVEALSDGIVEDPEAVRRYLETAQHDIASLARLIDDLFEMAKIDAGGLVLERSPSSLTDLISDTLESFAVRAKQRNVELTGSVSPGTDPVLMDARQIERVLTNLIDNALQHTPAGGAISLRAYAADDRAYVEVRDTGTGIAAEDLPHVFDQFYRGEKSRSRATGGAGLGLAIAKGIVEAHGGEIQVESQPGAGTTFILSLAA